MSSLYELTEELVSLHQLLFELGGDVTEGTEGATLEQWAQEYDWKHRQKVDGYASLIKGIEADVEQMEAEMARLRERAQVFTNRAARLKALAKFSMERLQTRKLEGVKFTISIQKNGGKPPLEILGDPALVVERMPDRFVKVRKSPDNDALREALAKDDPEAAKFAKIGEPGESVRVR